MQETPSAGIVRPHQDETQRELSGNAPPPDHLGHSVILEIIRITSRFCPVIVGGQSIGILAQFYAVKHPELMHLAPFSSRDIDFHNNPMAAKELAERLEGGRLFLPSASDMRSANASLVTGKIEGRPVVIDFMASVLGVRTQDIIARHLTLFGQFAGETISFHVMHPLDCLRSRLSNINILKRFDEQSIRQARTAIEVVGHHVDMLIASGKTKDAQSDLHEMQFIIRDLHAGKPTHLDFEGAIKPLSILHRFAGDDRLDRRWRELTLGPAIVRLTGRMSCAKAGRASGLARGKLDTPEL
jgi:hypothetical protein